MIPTTYPVQLVSVPDTGVPSVGVTNTGLVARATAPVPELAVTATPLMLKLLPVPAVSKVLLVKVSVVALPTKVSVAAGSVRVPEAATAGVSVVVPEVLPDRVLALEA